MKNYHNIKVYITSGEIKELYKISFVDSEYILKSIRRHGVIWNSAKTVKELLKSLDISLKNGTCEKFEIIKE
jgi:hypothetical protein